jgi:hypothetical protein
MQHDILALAGPDASTRQALYDFVMESLQALETLDAQRLRPVRQRLVNQRDALLAFATRLDGELDRLAQRFAVPVFRLRQVLALQERAPTTPAYWSQVAALQHSLHGQFYAIDQALLELRHRLHRASSLVENLNRRLRNYFFLRRQIGPQYLDLLRFFLNPHPFQRSHHPHRVGKTPTELLTGQSHPHWLELLRYRSMGFTRFQRASQAA